MSFASNQIAIIKEAKKLAREHGCVVSERDGKFLVYRLTPVRAVYLGSRSTPTTLRQFVRSVTTIH